MAEKDPNLEGNIDVSELSSISLDDETLEGLDVDKVIEASNSGESVENPDEPVSALDDVTSDISTSNTIDESVFLDSGDNAMARKNVLKDDDKFGSYLRWFFFSTLITLLGVGAIALFYSFSVYLKEATDPTTTRASYVASYKEKYKKVKDMVGIQNIHTAPELGSSNETLQVNEIINAEDIDYIEKKDLLSDYARNLVNKAQDRANYAENLKQEIAKQGFLPEELETLLSEDQAIDTIQRSLNALEVIKFSTATKVFSYMNTALTTISEMIRVGGANIESLRNLFNIIGHRGEKDISSYVYMCYLNPFETNSNCDSIGELDLYYSIMKDDSIDIRLFKNAMSAISQLLEKEDTSLFSITFNGFNAKDKSIQFNIEVFTNQEDERALMQQGKRNPNIFILTNIINLLKQSSFIIGAEINTKEINVETKAIDQGSITRNVNYSTMDFEVPIQKDTEREIFDYIDLNSMKELLSDRGFKQSAEKLEDTEEFDMDETNLELDSDFSEEQLEQADEQVENTSITDNGGIEDKNL